MDTVNQYYTFECSECGNIAALDFLGGMAARHCPECGAFLGGRPDAQIAVIEQRKEGFYECFDCGHTFGYASGFDDHRFETPSCTSCGSDNTGRV